MVEKWLLKVQHLMIQSMIDITAQSVNNYNPETRAHWILAWPGQVSSSLLNIYQTIGIIKNHRSYNA